MASSKFIIYKGVEVLYTDLSNASPEEAIESLKQLRKNSLSCPLGSVLSIMNVSNTRYNSQLISYAKDLARENKPQILAATIFGFNDFTQLMLKSILLFAGRRDIKLTNSFEEGIEWLLQRYYATAKVRKAN